MTATAPPPPSRIAAPAPTERKNDAELRSIDPSLIDVAEQFNPRSAMNHELLQELAASVKSVGVLQPITIVRAADERFRLIVGHRRLAAAVAAKLESIPALVYDAIDDASQLQFAIIENLQREDMNPVDEALSYQRAMSEGSLSQKQLASIIGKSASHVSERLRLLKLPQSARTALASGTLPLSAAKPLGTLAGLKVPTATQITDAAVTLLTTDADLLDDFLEDANSMLYAIASEEAADGMPFLYRANAFSRQLPLAGHVEAEAVAKLDERMQRLGMRHITLDQADIDAARAYGCLIELESRFTPQRLITDPAFLVDRVNEALDLIDKRNAETTAKRATEPGRSPQPGSAPSGSPSSTGGSSTTTSVSALAARQQAERERAEKDRIAAIHANRELGLRLMKQLGSRKLDRTTAELLVRIVLSQNLDLAARGIAYTHEEFHELVTARQKNGKIRTTFTPIDRSDARQRAEEWVLRARSAEEVLGRLLQLLVAGVFADERAVAKSRRTSWHAPASRSTEPMLAKLARKLLPEHFHARADRLIPTPVKKPVAKPAKAANKPKQATPVKVAARGKKVSDAG
jgi:ParB/RepB/Spo0J family partition protein